MKDFIIGKLFLTREDKAKETMKSLLNLGFELDEFRREDIKPLSIDNTFIIEFIDMPLIFKNIKQTDIIWANYIDISKISDKGISFYLVSMKHGDGFVFVPMSNIKCIHIISDEEILNLIYGEH